MASVIAQMIAELEAAKKLLAPQIEGLNDFLRLPLPKATSAVQKQKTAYDARMALIDAGLLSLRNLVDDDYPTVDVMGLSEEAWAEIQAAFAAIQDALEQFRQGEAVGIETAVGVPELK